MILDSFTALRVEEIAAEIERTASNNIDGMSVKNYYEAALWQCFYLSDTNIKVDDLRRKVRITIQQSPKEQAHTLATTVVTCNLPLDEILPCTAKTLRETNDTWLTFRTLKCFVPFLLFFDFFACFFLQFLQFFKDGTSGLIVVG